MDIERDIYNTNNVEWKKVMELFNEKSQEELKAEFHKLRSMGIGGSDIGVVMGQSPYKTRYQLWLEKTKKVQAEDISGKFHVQRGVINEPVARAKYEEMSGMRFEPKSWAVEGREYLRCNDDGFCEQFGAMLEIKCMGREAHEAASNGVVPPHYYQQLQYNMGVAKANIGYFISYRPEDGSMHVVTVNPDLDLQATLMKAAEDFWLNHVMKNEPPEMNDDDFVSCIDPDFEAASEEYKKIKTEMKLLQEKLDMVETVLHGFLGNNSGIKQNNLTISRVVRKGNVDTVRMAQDFKIDVEKYRKPSSTYIKISTSNNG